VCVGVRGKRGRLCVGDGGGGCRREEGAYVIVCVNRDVPTPYVLAAENSNK